MQQIAQKECKSVSNILLLLVEASNDPGSNASTVCQSVARLGRTRAVFIKYIKTVRNC